MCGIAGVLLERPSAGAAAAAVEKMVSRLAHRGPDGSGTAVWDVHAAGDGAVALGHARLAVIDLSPRAAQPMRDARGSSAVSFNGEIYNFADLRRALEARGHTFRSESDTEVILEGYDEWGDGVVERLDGMFAFALWDGRRRRLLVARDRLGIKPLYFVERPGSFLVASELRALVASGLVNAALDDEALDQYLAYQTTATPRTLLRDVSYLEPGTVLAKTAGAPSTRRTYWSLLRDIDPEAPGATSASARRRVGELLEASARRHLVSDVPIGVFLSSGIDSTVLALEIARTGAAPRTFTVSFPGLPWDEGPDARRIAHAIGAEHTEIPLAESDLLRGLPDVLASVDHPSGDGVNTYVVSRAVRAAGFKVAWSGLGGDELFGGYPSFRRLAHARAWAGAWRHAPPAVRAATAAAVRGLGRSSVGREKAAAVLETDGSLPQIFPVLRQLFSRGQRRQLLGPDAPARQDPYVRLLQNAAGDAEQLGFQARIAFAEARTYMHDVLLRDSDQMSMRHGLEVRVPLLDHALVEYVMGLPDAARDAAAGPKALLAHRLAHVLPADLAGRPKKGFVLPFDAWMRSALRPYCEAHLFGGALMRRAGLHGPAIERLWTRFLDGRPDVTWTRPWTLVALAAWVDAAGASR
jgi:asparagine synthase (glutamine-hydrolysing)